MTLLAKRFPRSRNAGRPFLKSAKCRFESDWGHVSSREPSCAGPNH
ncbi:Uncharacterised protein [Mycobacteroides abscessus subsp. abscessus]|nr:Uncharacterised protein [Mycobacteroides abscessus subsp. abscessus]